MTATLTRHAYAGAHDLRRMQAAVAAAFHHTSWRTGDLAWASRNLSHLETATWVTLWEPAIDHDADHERATPLAWIWPSSKGSVDYFVAPGAGTDALLNEMVDAAEEVVTAALTAGDSVDAVTIMLDVSEDAAMIRVLRERGYAEVEDAFDINRRALDGLTKPALPAGYRFTAVTDALVDARVEAQRAAFAPSALTAERYRRVRRTWPYRADLDRIVVDDTGEVVAFCTAWLDDHNADGLLEPVGTRPSHQRRGLATAVCWDALRALRDAGARTAQVACESGSNGCATYRAVGFSSVAHAIVMRRSLDGSAQR